MGAQSRVQSTSQIVGASSSNVAQTNMSSRGGSQQRGDDHSGGCTARVGVVYRGSMVLVGDIILEADLIPLDMVDLDVILGMDWLAKHYALVDYFWKEVVLRSPGLPEVTFCYERRVLLSCLISAMKVRRLLRNGCSGYLAHVIDTPG
ncbi:hypothetical protein L3X38_009820 [Prunus dulcis]|uniref:Uncharacterized protein n=1 Tax=Prunus dulcis TaxID=3755 RepID=A0AAD4WE91_PRUDU|nr:hypothetical protein L3X38_009820 [Prunus dulcis]